MKGARSSGAVLTITCPSGGMTVGVGYLVGTMFGVANSTQLAGEQIAVQLEGKLRLAKATGQAWATVGAKIYWDDTAKNLTTTASGNSLVGAVGELAASGDVVGYVVLNGITI